MASDTAPPAPVTTPQLQLVIDCADPDRLARFWAAALGYVPPPPPDGHDSWADWYRSVGVPEDEIDDGVDRLVDPTGTGPSVWFQPVPEAKSVKNRLHLDLLVAGRGTPIAERRRIVDAEVERLVGLGATIVRVVDGDVRDHYAVTLGDPEGNEFCVG
ncbi:MAG TPA: VOC family protein [Euzebyales bacterium]